MHTADVEAQEDGGHDEAKHRDKHHPALQHGDRDLRGCHQDPDKAPKDNFRNEEHIWESPQDSQAARQRGGGTW